MTYATRDLAYADWVPKDAVVLSDRHEHVVFLWSGSLYVMTLMQIGTGSSSWHVSMDVELPLDELARRMPT